MKERNAHHSGRKRGLVRKYFFRTLAESVAALTALTLFAAIAAWLFLGRTELVLEPYIPVIEKQIENALPGWDASVSELAIGIAGGRPGLVVKIRNLGLASQGEKISIETLEARLDMVQLFRFRFVPEQISLSDADLRFIASTAEGMGLSLISQTADAPQPAAHRLVDMLFTRATGDNGEVPALFQHLDALNIDRARITLAAPNGDVFWHSSHAYFELSRAGAGLHIHLLAYEQTAGSGKFGAGQFDGFLAPNGTGQILEAQIDKIPLRAFLFFAPDLRNFIDPDFPVEGDVAFELSPERVLRSSTIALRADAGTVVLPTVSPTPHPLVEIELVAALDFVNESLDVQRMSYRLARKEANAARQAVLRGRLLFSPEEAEKKKTRQFHLSFSGENIYTEIPDTAPGGFLADAIAGNVLLEPDNSLIRLEFVRIEGEEGQIELSGTIGGVSGGGVFGEFGDFDIIAHLYEMPVAYLPRLFPASFSPASHAWIRNNLHAGLIEQGVFHVESVRSGRASPLPSGKFSTGLSFSFRGAHFTYAPDMMPARDAAGRCTLRGVAFVCDFEGGEVKLPGRTPIMLTGGSVTIADITRSDGTGLAEVAFSSYGVLEDLLDWFDSPLQYLTGGALPAWLDRASGNGVLNGDLIIPLKEGLSFADIIFHFHGQFAEFAPATSIFPAIDVELRDARGAFSLSSESLIVRGNSLMNGTEAQFSWTQPLSPQAAHDAKFTLAGDFISGEWELPASMGVFSVYGPVSISGQFARDKTSNQIVAQINGSLNELTFTQSTLGWHKRAGEQGDFTLELTAGDDFFRVDRLRLDAPTLALTTSFSLDSAWALAEGRLTAETEGGAILMLSAREIEEGLRIDIDADAVDIRELLDTGLSLHGSEEASDTNSVDARDIVLVAQVDTATAHDDVLMRDARLYLQRYAGVIEHVNFAADLVAEDKWTPFRIWRDKEKKNRLVLTSGDAGLTARALGMAGMGLHGGALAVEARLPENEEDDITGRLVVRDFAISDAPAALQWLSLGFQGDEMVFRYLSAPFAIGKETISFRNSSMTSFSLGVFFSGDYHRRARWLSFQGTVSPLYGINSALAAVPLLGPLLTGGKGEGVIGVQFNISGDINEPIVSVNPGSVLMPGITRDLLQGESPPASGQPQIPPILPEVPDLLP